MTDTAFNLLLPALKQAKGDSLWIADENLLQAQLPSTAGVQAMTNRLDLHQALNQQGWQSQFSDFDFSTLADQSLDRVIYRVSKEKPVVHHIINQACRVLKTGGVLELAGEKGEGIKSYIDKAKKLFGGQCHAEKADRNYWHARLTRPTTPGPALDDSDYASVRDAVSDEQFSFRSKPGLFGWNKVDKGSQFLIEQLDTLLDGQQPQRCLDLGCGYGYLSLHLAHYLKAQGCDITATDNNAAAIQCCQQNFEQQHVNGQVIAANCAQGISGPFDLIICNPPFHTGFSVENSLTDRFLAAAATRLSTQGSACFVVNKHIALEKKARHWFKTIDTCADNGHFKLVRLRQPLCS